MSKTAIAVSAGMFALAVGVAMLAGAVLAQGATPEAPGVVLGSGFSYQGQLKRNGAAVTGLCDVTFGLWTHSSGGTQFGSPSVHTNVPVTNGLFTVQVNASNEFGPSVFDGSARFLETTIRCAADAAPVTLTRQLVTAAPYAQHAASASVLQRYGHSETVIDGNDHAGRDVSIAIGGDGLPLIAYWISNTADLRVAHCNDIACTAATLTDIDTAGDVGQHLSLAIGKTGFGYISYYDGTNGNLKLAACQNSACSSALTSTVDDSLDNVGQHTALAVGGGGFDQSRIAYYNASVGWLKFAQCSSANCFSKTIKDIVTGTQNVGRFAAITPDGEHVAYFNATRGSLEFRYDTSGPVVTRTLDISAAAVAPVALFGPDFFPLIVYAGRTAAGAMVPRTAHCLDRFCTQVFTRTLETVGDVTALGATIAADGVPIIVANTGIYRCGDPRCETPPGKVLTILPILPGSRPAIVIGVDGMPIIVFQSTARDLVVWHCSNRFCQRGMREK